MKLTPKAICARASLLLAATLTLTCVANAAPIQAQEDTVALWSFAKPANTQGTIIFADQAPNAIPLRPDQSSPQELSWADGPFGQALRFNADLRLVAQARRPAIELPSNQITVELWLAPSTEGDLGSIFQYGDYKKNGFRITSTTSRRIVFLLQNGEAEVSVHGKAQLEQGAWYHIAVTYEGSTARIYINGVLDSEKEVPGAILQPANNNHLSVGYIGGGKKLQASLAAIRISNTAKTADQLK